MRVSYVPYSEDFSTLFEFCGISLSTSDYGGNTGWDAAAFGAAAAQAIDYLNDNYDTLAGSMSEEELEQYYNMLDNYSIYYWSTESPIYG